jgi:hypothetical protein
MTDRSKEVIRQLIVDWRPRNSQLGGPSLDVSGVRSHPTWPANYGSTVNRSDQTPSDRVQEAASLQTTSKRACNAINERNDHHDDRELHQDH